MHWLLKSGKLHLPICQSNFYVARSFWLFYLFFSWDSQELEVDHLGPWKSDAVTCTGGDLYTQTYSIQVKEERWVLRKQIERNLSNNLLLNLQQRHRNRISKGNPLWSGKDQKSWKKWAKEPNLAMEVHTWIFATVYLKILWCSIAETTGPLWALLPLTCQWALHSILGSLVSDCP